jgi:ribosomal protein L12E/L44/L45/RPP1/RPP2
LIGLFSNALESVKVTDLISNVGAPSSAPAAAAAPAAGAAAPAAKKGNF